MEAEKKLLEGVENIIGSIYENNQSKDIKELLFRYIDEIKNWNKIHNIISRSSENILENVCDSISIIKFLKEYFLGNNPVEKIVDVGSGNGFPGIPLAILLPEIKFILIDSNRKKCSFLRMLKSQLKLSNISVENKIFDSSYKESLAVSKAAFSPTNSQVLISGLKVGGKVILWATPNTRDDFISEMNNASGRLCQEYYFILPNGKERLFLVFEKV